MALLRGLKVVARRNLGPWRRRKIGRRRLRWEDPCRTLAGACSWDTAGARTPHQVADHIVAPHAKMFQEAKQGGDPKGVTPVFDVIPTRFTLTAPRRKAGAGFTSAHRVEALCSLHLFCCRWTHARPPDRSTR